MATTQTYKCIINNAPIKSRTSLLSSNLGNLKKDALIEVISISRLWAYFNYNNKNAYILTLYIQKLPEVVTGSITIRCLNKDTKAEITNPLTIDNISLKSYTYTAPSIANYTVVEPSRISITFTAENPDQEVIFYYKENKIYGSITISYIEKGTNTSIAPSLTNNNLELGTYSYNSIDIPGYQVSGASSKSVTLTKDAYNQTIIFEYTKILGSVFIKYVDIDTKTEIAPNEYYANLELKSYDYKAKSIDEYTVVEPSSRTVTLTVSSPTQNIVFYYKQNKIYGSITINYIDKATNTSIAPSVTNSNLELGAYSYNSIDIAGYEISGLSSKSVTLTKEMPNQSIAFEYTKNVVDDTVYVIDLKKYSISNNNTNANATTKGINQALVDAKAAGYKKVKLPEGHYAIDTSVDFRSNFKDTTNNIYYCDGKGIIMQSNIELILDNSILHQVPCKDPYYSIIAVNNCNNSKITGGTLLGDRETHDYGMRINNNGNELEKGSIDISTGKLLENNSMVRTKDFITTYVDWFTNDVNILPSKFHITPLWNTTKNTVDGGVRYVHCYDDNENYLGTSSTNGNSFLSEVVLLDNTSKIKLTFKDETNLKSVYSLTKLSVYYTYEFGCGISLRSSDNVIIDGTTIKDCIGDCILVRETLWEDTLSNVTNCEILNCTLENSRRQGISFVAHTNNILVKGCNIGKINGVDPQCGIDFESGRNIGDVKNIIVKGCKFYDNRKWDIDNYDGSDIEIRNCKFNGAIATVSGNKMKIYNNIFHAVDNNFNNPNVKLINQCGVALGTSDNYVYDNEFIYASCYNSGINSQTYNNKYTNSNISIVNNTINKYFDCNIEIERTENFNMLEGNEFINCSITISAKNINGISIKKCNFNNSQLNPRFNTVLDDCIFSMTDKSIRKGGFLGDTIAIYNNCTFKSTYTKDIKLLENMNIKSTFNNCIFDISRYTLSLNYGTIIFNNCTFKFNNLNTDSKVIDLNLSGYGFLKCPWYFNTCDITSNYPIKIYGNNIVDCKLNENIILS